MTTNQFRSLIKISEVERIVALKRSTIYALIQRGLFPKQIKLSARASAWDSGAVQAWIEQRIQHSGQSPQ